LTDWSRPAPDGPPAAALPEDLVTEVPVADLDATGVLADAPATAWCRRRRTLLQAAERLTAAAVAPADRLEAWVVWEPSASGGPAAPPSSAARILALGAAPDGAGPALLPLLVGWVANRLRSPLLLPRSGDDEPCASDLGAAGLVPGRRYELLAATARPL
jgi:hypothetical protein